MLQFVKSVKRDLIREYFKTGDNDTTLIDCPNHLFDFDCVDSASVLSDFDCSSIDFDKML